MFPLNRVCRLDDWSAPELRNIMREVLSYDEERLATKPQRKQWEWAMGWLTLEHYGFLTRERTALGLGCGHERFMYALTNRIGHVTGTDLYGETGFSEDEARADVLTDPGAFSPIPFEADRLTVHSMNALEISYPDNHFDIVFSFSSLEHFGDDDAIIRAMSEAYRVLKPGGIYALDVDYIFRAPRPHPPRNFRSGGLSEFMTRPEVKRLVIDAAGFELRGPIDWELDLPADANVFDIVTNKSTSGEYYPHAYLRSQGRLGRKYYFSSLNLALFKPE